MNIRSRGFVHNTVLLDKWWNVLNKFSKQIASSLAKIINGYKGRFKALLNMEFFLQVVTGCRGELRVLPKIFQVVNCLRKNTPSQILKGVLSTPVFRLHLVMFCVIIGDI